jgi:AraC family transcriptional regulator
MGASASPPISATHYSELAPFRPRASAAWSDFTVHVVDQRAGFRETMSFADHVLNLRIAGNCRLRQDVDGRSFIGRSGPGCINVIPARLSAQWEASPALDGSRVIAMFVPEAFVARVAEESGLEAGKIEIVPQFLIRNRVVDSVLTALALEAQNGSPSGPLYAESACEFIAHHLVYEFSSRSRSLPRSKGGLSRPGLRAVLDYIEDSLAEPITLRQLAHLARVSPRHFERAFRQAVGSPPHAYVIEKRVAAARSLLLTKPELTVETVAMRVGFSSSSHLSAAFRRHMGCSPAAFRRMHSR